MPKRSLSKRNAPDEYESDDGFVEDAPKSKKNKQKDAKADISLDMQKDDEGNEFWEISRQRRVQVSDFKGLTMIGIREFYEKDGKALPGKKGISLNIDQFTALVQVLPQIHKVLTAKGINVPKPQFDSTDAVDDQDVDKATATVAADPDAEESEDEVPAKSKTKSQRSKSKMNHEATSDEDED